jgi:hypothetical protein
LRRLHFEDPIDIFANGGDVGACLEEGVCRELGICMAYGVGGAKTQSSSALLKAAGLLATTEV